MKKAIFIILLTIPFSVALTSAQSIMAGLGEDPSNVCFPGEVYYGVTQEAVPREPVLDIERRLNETVAFVKNNPDFRATPAVSFAVGCRGQLGGGFYMATRSGNSELDRELIQFFQTVDEWRPGEQERQPVDSWFTWRMSINNGYITILNYIDWPYR